MSNLNYCAGSWENGIDNFYYDTRFASFEEAAEWGKEHDCTHVYDATTDSYIEI